MNTEEKTEAIMDEETLLFWKKYFSVHNIALSILLLLLIVFGFILGDIMLYAAAIICGIKIFTGTNRMKNKRYPKSKAGEIVKTAIVLFVVISVSLLKGPIAARKISFYGLQKAWVSMKYNLDDDFLPEELSGDGYYRMDTMPSILQGSGWVSVCFWYDPLIAKDEDINELISGYSDRAVKTFKLSEYSEPDIGKNLDNDTVSIYYYKEMWEGHEDKATVYVLKSSGTGNHPHSTAFIIDTEEGIMEFSKLG